MSTTKMRKSWSDEERRARAVFRFWQQVEKKTADECWPWTGALWDGGYGAFNDGFRQIGAHRFSFFLHGGELVATQEVCHRCDNPKCCNPSHLVAGTHCENMRYSAKDKSVGRFQQYRESRQWTRAIAGEAFGVNERTIAKWERRERLPRPEMAKKIERLTSGAVKMVDLYT